MQRYYRRRWRPVVQNCHWKHHKVNIVLISLFFTILVCYISMLTLRIAATIKKITWQNRNICIIFRIQHSFRDYCFRNARIQKPNNWYSRIKESNSVLLQMMMIVRHRMNTANMYIILYGTKHIAMLAMKQNFFRGKDEYGRRWPIDWCTWVHESIQFSSETPKLAYFKPICIEGGLLQISIMTRPICNQ